MIGHLWKLALVVALSHGYRAVGRTVGPRWAGLITALPCSTAVALLGGGSDRGVDYAVAMADACWASLAGASALPLAFASATVAGWGMVRSLALGVLSYFAVMAGMILLGTSAGSYVPGTVLFLAWATWMATRIDDQAAPSRAGRRNFSDRQVFWIRTVVPATCLGGALGLGERLGPGVAGCLGAFPGVTLTTLMLTRLEISPAASVRMARALPPGNWAMVAFLTTFTQTAQTLGLWGSITFGYASALICLGTVAHLTNPPTAARFRRRLRMQRRKLPAEAIPELDSGQGWPRTPRRFSPLVESVAA